MKEFFGKNIGKTTFFSLFFLMLLLCGCASKIVTKEGDGVVSKYALLIQVSDYEFLEAKKTDKPDVSSIVRLQKIFISNGYDLQLVYGPEATRRNILQAINRLSWKTDKEDKVIIIIAGDVITNQTDERKFLISRGTRLSDLEVSAIPIDQLFSVLNQFGTRQQLLVLDLTSLGITTGFFEQRELYSGRYRYDDRDRILDKIAQASKGVKIFTIVEVHTGSELGDKESERPTIFELAATALENSAADYDSDGKITSKELVMYLTERREELYESQYLPLRKIRKGQTKWTVIEVGENGKVVLSSATLKIYKKLLASWSVNGWIDIKTHFQLHSFLDKIVGKTEKEIDADCLQLYKDFEKIFQHGIFLGAENLVVKQSELVEYSKMMSRQIALEIEYTAKKSHNNCLLF